MLSGRILAESDCECPLETFQADGELARSMKVLKISSDIKTITLSTDERGHIFFPVQGDLRRENSGIRIFEQGKFRKIKKFHVVAPRLSEMRVNDNFAGTIIHPQKNAVRKADMFIIYYPEEMLDEAYLSAKELHKEQKFIAELLGIQPSAIGVNLVANDDTFGSFQNSISIKAHIERKTRDRNDRESNQTLSANQKILFFGPPNHVTLQLDSEHTIFSYFCGWHTNEVARWINVHEWTEISLEGDEVRLHRSDKKRRNRIFVDDLADYVGIHYKKNSCLNGDRVGKAL